MASQTAVEPQVFRDAPTASPNTHKVVLDNDRVRILDIRIEPGRTAPMHSHPDYVAYALTACRVRFTYPDGKSEEIVLKEGDCLFRKAENHSAENIGPAAIHALNFELKR